MSYKTGGTGKGSAVRIGLNKELFGKNLDILQKKEPKRKSCSSCKLFRGFNIMDATICDADVVFYVGGKNEGEDCSSWRWNHEPK